MSTIKVGFRYNLLMLEILITLSSGVILLLFSTKIFVSLSKTLSQSLRLSPLVIGMTVVAVGTSLPELSVSTIASIRQDYSLAIGNIIGSNIVNILMIFSVAILIGNLRIGTTKTPRNTLVLLFITIAYTLTHHIQILPKQTLGLLFIISALGLTFVEYKWALFGRTHEDIGKFNDAESIRFSTGKIIMLLISIAGVITGGYFIVTSTEGLSLLTGISTGVLGLTLTAIATSLPELLTTIFAQEEHDEKMTLGNIIGSNIYNLLLIGGIIELFNKNPEVLQVNWLVLNLVTQLFAIIILVYRGKIVPKWIGATSLILFIAYILLETL